MSNLMIPGPGGAEPEKTGHKQAQGKNGGGGAGADASHDSRQRHSKKRGIPSENDCLLAIAQVAGLAAMGLLKVGQANAVRAAYRDILSHHKSKAKEAEKSPSNSDVMDLLRKDPKLLNLLAPLMTSEQIDMVMNAGKRARMVSFSSASASSTWRGPDFVSGPAMLAGGLPLQ